MKRILNKLFRSSGATGCFGVLYFDGLSWYGVVYSSHSYVHWPGSSQDESVPDELMEWLKGNGVKHVRLLLSTEVQLLDFAVPEKMGYEETAMLLSNELSIITGEDSEDIICSAVSSLNLGMKDHYLLVGSFHKSTVDGFRRKLEEAGFLFDGIGCLELSFFAYCSNKYNINYDSFIVFGESHSFALPGNQHLKRVGPMSLPGGRRNAELDYSGWLLKVEKRLRNLNECSAVYCLIVNPESRALQNGLEELLSEDSVTLVDYTDIREKLSHLSTHTKVNCFSSPLSIVNDKVPRKLFSHLFIIVPVLITLLVPFLYWGAAEYSFSQKMRKLDQTIAQYIPLEKSLNKAKQERKKIQAVMAGVRAEKAALLARRRPLHAFIHMAYFFSKFGGHIVKLNYLGDTGRQSLRIKGVYIDPERRVEMKSRLDEFVKTKQLKIVQDNFSGEFDRHGKYVLVLDMIIDYKELN